MQAPRESIGDMIGVLTQCAGYSLLSIGGLIIVVTYAYWIGGISCTRSVDLFDLTGSISTCAPCLECGNVCKLCSALEDSSSACQPRYARWLKYTWNIVPPPVLVDGRESAGPITLSVAVFGLEQSDRTCTGPSRCCDYVQIFDGLGDQAPLLGTFCGSARPPAITSSGPTMRVVFFSDGRTEALGFSALFTAANFSHAGAQYPQLVDVYSCTAP